MIRLAVDDSNTELKADTTFLHTEVTTRTGPYPPHESVESIGQRVADPHFICMIDDGPNTVAGFYVVTEDRLSRDKDGKPNAPVEEARVPHVIVIWWLPRARWAEDNMPLLMPVFGRACEEVLRRYPDSEDWPIYGDYPGVGETPEERTKSSLDMVTEWRDFWNQSPVGAFAELGVNPYNETQCRIIGTVGKVVQFVAWLAEETP